MLYCANFAALGVCVRQAFVRSHPDLTLVGNTYPFAIHCMKCYPDRLEKTFNGTAVLFHRGDLTYLNSTDFTLSYGFRFRDMYDIVHTVRLCHSSVAKLPTKSLMPDRAIRDNRNV